MTPPPTPRKGPVHPIADGTLLAEHGVKVTVPVAVLRAYLPSPETMTVVAVQFGGTCAGDAAELQRRIELVVSVTPAGAVSFESRSLVWITPCSPDEVSATSVGRAGGVTVGVIVDDTTCPNASATWYDCAGAVPVNVASGVNVTMPVEVLTEYVPFPETVTLVAVQFGEVCPEPHRRRVLGAITVPVLAASFTVGLIV